jgi:hypothetical protein
MWTNILKGYTLIISIAGLLLSIIQLFFRKIDIDDRVSAIYDLCCNNRIILIILCFSFISDKKYRWLGVLVLFAVLLMTIERIVFGIRIGRFYM